MVIDVATARGSDIDVGDLVTVTTEASAATDFEVVGLASFGEEDDLGGATLALFDLKTMQELLGKPGQMDGVVALAAPGTDVPSLITRVDAALPDGAVAQSGQSAAEERSAELHESLSFLFTFLLVFAIVALFVGTFIIYNTFRIVVAQRTKELALLRAIGASRRQVMANVIVEAGIVGVISSIVGILVGLGLAVVLREGLSAAGINLPADNLVLSVGTVVAALTVGMGTTVVSALVPAYRASKVPPVAAMRPDAAVRDELDDVVPQLVEARRANVEAADAAGKTVEV